MPITMDPPPEWKRTKKWAPVTAIIILVVIFAGPPLWRWIKREYNAWQEGRAAKQVVASELCPQDILSLSDKDLWDLPKSTNPTIWIDANEIQPIEIKFDKVPMWSPEIVLPSEAKGYDYRISDSPDTGFAVRFFDGVIERCEKGGSVKNFPIKRGIFRLLGIEAGQTIKITFDIVK